MDFSFFVHIVAMLFSFFVAGVLLGALFSESVRTKFAKFLRRSSHNPILRPGTHPWNAEAVLNPAAAVIPGRAGGGRTHLVYRAIGTDGVSRLGYASSADGIVFDERLPYPIYAARNPGGALPGSRRRYSPVMYPSGGSWGGCEDPRMVVIDGYVYITFNMFENWMLRVAVISMSEEDFLAKRFHRWEGPIILSAHSSHSNREKNWMLFPEKIGDRFAVLHGIIDPDENRVRIEYADDLDTLSQRKISTIDPQEVPNKNIAWHIHVRSAGPPPVRTDRGWLVLYHAHDAAEPNRYKLGAMLLDLVDPTKILYRSASPVLSPDEYYENDGKPGVVYACGAVVHNGTLFVYYGGADKVVCVATAPLDSFLDALVEGDKPALTPQKTQTI
jgi:predicted GH43/DUF377 family glycosyl hydrolase